MNHSPLTVLRRLDCVLAPTKDKVLRRKEELRGRGLQDFDGQLRKASGFYRYTPPRPLEEIEADIRAIETNIMRMLSEVTGGASGAEPGRAG